MTTFPTNALCNYFVKIDFRGDYLMSAHQLWNGLKAKVILKKSNIGCTFVHLKDEMSLTSDNDHAVWIYILLNGIDLSVQDQLKHYTTAEISEIYDLEW